MKKCVLLLSSTFSSDTLVPQWTTHLSTARVTCLKLKSCSLTDFIRSDLSQCDMQWLTHDRYLKLCNGMSSCSVMSLFLKLSSSRLLATSGESHNVCVFLLWLCSIDNVMSECRITDTLIISSVWFLILCFGPSCVLVGKSHPCWMLMQPLF